jgi:hypothetical protein
MRTHWLRILSGVLRVYDQRASLEHEGNDALHALLVRPILLRKLLAHELFFFAQLDPKAGEREHDGDESAQMPEGNGGRERPVTARCRYDFLR